MKILITGGAGFIGSNASDYFLHKGYKITIFDNFSRNGSRENVKWLMRDDADIEVLENDIRTDTKELELAVAHADFILHLAGQVAVTSSIENPREDFESNCLGTLNVLEALRKQDRGKILIYSSTNKVYGNLLSLPIIESDSRYEFKNLPYGVSEEMNLDFHSPYGCSKGSADQYVRDYSRIYGLNTIVFRQSCIYGPRQFGVEDQGWIAWFMIALLKGKKITIFGDGKQVRDVLYISDLLKAYELAFENIHKTRGQIYNIGGGRNNTISIGVEFRTLLENLSGTDINFDYSQSRKGDQQIYISDIRKAKSDFNWEPEVTIHDGVQKLYSWINENKLSFK